MRERKVGRVQQVLPKCLVIVWKCPSESGPVALRNGFLEALRDVVWQWIGFGRRFFKGVFR